MDQTPAGLPRDYRANLYRQFAAKEVKLATAAADIAARTVHLRRAAEWHARAVAAELLNRTAKLYLRRVPAQPQG